MKTPEEIRMNLYSCSMDDCVGCSMTLDHTCINHLLRRAAVCIKWLEDAQPQWISVRDRLPNAPGEYLASSNEYVITLEFDGVKWHDFSGARYFVDAWMPKPEGYKLHDWDGDADENA